MTTVENLKKQYKTFKAAKLAEGFKAKSWAALAEKINNAGLQARIVELEAENAALKQQLANTPEFDWVGFWLQDGNFERSNFEDFGTPADATYKESAARKFYKELARRYHPDLGGTNEQMANIKLLEDQMLGMVVLNEGVGK